MKKILIVVGVVVVGAVGWYLGSPLFIDKEVNEAFPAWPTPDEIATMAPDERAAARDKTLKEAASMPGKTMEEAMPPAAPKLLGQGRFRDVDAVHKGSGDAKLYRMPDDSLLVRLENLDVANGPDLYVYLVKHPDPATDDHVTDGGYISLGKLKGNKGNQNYPVPAGTKAEEYGSIVVWCQLFGVLFSPAALQKS